VGTSIQANHRRNGCPLADPYRGLSWWGQTGLSGPAICNRPATAGFELHSKQATQTRDTRFFVGISHATRKKGCEVARQKANAQALFATLAKEFERTVCSSEKGHVLVINERFLGGSKSVASITPAIQPCSLRCTIMTQLNAMTKPAITKNIEALVGAQALPHASRLRAENANCPLVKYRLRKFISKLWYISILITKEHLCPLQKNSENLP